MYSFLSGHDFGRAVKFVRGEQSVGLFFSVILLFG